MAPASCLPWCCSCRVLSIWQSPAFHRGWILERLWGLAASVSYDLPRFRLFGHVYCMKSCWLAGLEPLLALGDLTHAVAQAMDEIFIVVFEYSVCFLFVQQCKENRPSTT